MIGPLVLPDHALILVTVIVWPLADWTWWHPLLKRATDARTVGVVFAVLDLATGSLWSAIPIDADMELSGGDLGYGALAPADAPEAR